MLDAAKILEERLLQVGALSIPAAAPAVEPKPFDTGLISAAELAGLDLPPLHEVVRGILHEGLSILAGPPKCRKSFLCLDLALSVALGTRWLGFETILSEVLYLCLEDSRRRVQWRMRQMLKIMGLPPGELRFATDWPRLGCGGLRLLEEHLVKYPQTKLVVVDVLQRVKDPVRPGQNSYASDYDSLSPLHDLARKYHVAILLVSHFNKTRQVENAADRISGSTGMQGSPDALFLMARGSEPDQVMLSITGRDVDPRDLTLRFDRQSLTFRCLGDTAELNRSAIEAGILEALRGGRRLTPRALRDETGCSLSVTSKTLRRLLDEGTILTKGKKKSRSVVYFLPEDSKAPEIGHHGQHGQPGSAGRAGQDEGWVLSRMSETPDIFNPQNPKA